MIPKCVTFAQMVQAAFVREIISVRSYQPRDRNTRNRTDLPLRPKITGNQTTLEDVKRYRPHLVPLPFPLVGLWLKVVLLLLPTGSSTRKVPSVRHVMNSMKNLRKIGFKLNDEKLFPGQIPRRILKSECEVLRTSSMSLHEDLTERFGGGHEFWPVITLFGKFGPLLTKYIRRKKERKNRPEVRFRDGHAEQVCKISRSI